MKNAVLAIIVLVLLISGCDTNVKSAAGTPAASKPVASALPDSEGAKLLKGLLRRYSAMKSFSANVHWDQQVGSDKPTAAERKLRYAAPNKFHAEVAVPDKGGKTLTLIAACNGQEYVEYGGGGDEAIKYAPPPTIGHVSGLQMGHPMFSGTMLYTFFDGESAYPNIVDTTKPVELSESTLANGKKVQVVRFTSALQFGNIVLSIDPATGLVQELSYDSAPVIAKLKEQQGGEGPPSSKTTEKYSNIKVDESIPESAFSTRLPRGVVAKTVDEMQQDLAQGLKAGTEAPDFTVNSAVDGKPVTLSSLKGKVVLVDFWATWCGPCRIGLPRTQALYKELKSKGLEVLAVSDEEPAKINEYVKSSGLELPFYSDAAHKAAVAYKITGLPTTVVIDRQGKVVADLEGLRDDSVIRDAVKQAGIE